MFSRVLSFFTFCPIKANSNCIDTYNVMIRSSEDLLILFPSVFSADVRWMVLVLIISLMNDSFIEIYSLKFIHRLNDVGTEML